MGTDATPPRGRPLPASTPAAATTGGSAGCRDRRARSGGDPEHRAPNSLPLPRLRHGRRRPLRLLAGVKGPKGKVAGGHCISGCSRFLPFPLSLAARASSWARAGLVVRLGPARPDKRPSRPCLGRRSGTMPISAWPGRHDVPCRPKPHRAVPYTFSLAVAIIGSRLLVRKSYRAYVRSRPQATSRGLTGDMRCVAIRYGLRNEAACFPVGGSLLIPYHVLKYMDLLAQL